MGNNPSYVWRSLWKARDVLRVGCRWSIGDGSNIKVMHESWLRGTKEVCLGGPQMQGVYDFYVQNLMLPNTKQWDVNVITSVFDPIEAEVILSTPLVWEVVEDGLIRKEEKNEEYSVRSRYRSWR